MATSDILGLFTTPEQYQLAQRQAQDAEALQYAKLDPMAQAQYGFYRAGQQIGGAIGGALGGEDPQLKLISQRQQILGMIDPTNPDTYAQGIQMALQTGDTQTAFILRNEMMRAKEQAQQQEIRGFEREKFLLDRGMTMKQRGMEAAALSVANGIDPETGLRGKSILNEKGEVIDTQALKPLIDPTTNKFNQDVANTLISQYGQVGANIVKQRIEGVQGVQSLQTQELARQLFNEDGTRNPEIEKKLSVTVEGRDILKKLAPETKELKKGEKLLERQPDGTWSLITPAGQPAQTVTSDNAVQALIAGRAIHPSVLPYAQQLAKNFANLDFEDQNVLMEKLTRLNSDAKNTESSMNLRQDMFESNKTFREVMANSSAGIRTLQKELIQLKIDQAKQAQVKAADGKEIKIGESTKLSDQSVKVDKLVDISQKFQPNFAGYPTNAAGDIAVWAASKSSDPNDVALVQWWQNYQEHVNTVRNDLFGAALTAPEKAEFEKAMVTKGMNPTQAQTNLRRQADAALKAYDKLDKVLRSQGYSRSALDILKPAGFGGTPPAEVPVGVTVTVKKKGG
jgi:hypothetical protein